MKVRWVVRWDKLEPGEAGGPGWLTALSDAWDDAPRRRSARQMRARIGNAVLLFKTRAEAEAAVDKVRREWYNNLSLYPLLEARPRRIP